MTERFANPLLRGFLFGWLVFNYRLLMVIFSGDAVERRMELINSILYPDWFTWTWRALLAPGVFAYAYIFLLPIVSQRFFEKELKTKRTLTELKQKIANETPVTQEELDNFRAYANETITHLRQTIAARDEEIRGIQARLNLFEAQQRGRAPTTGMESEAPQIPQMNSTAEDDSRSVPTGPPQMPRDQRYALQTMAKFEDEGHPRVHETTLVDRLKTELELGATAARYAVDTLVNQGLIESHAARAGGFILSLSHDGRRVALQHLES